MLDVAKVMFSRLICEMCCLVRAGTVLGIIDHLHRRFVHFKRQAPFLFAIGGELRPKFTPETFRQRIAEILLHGNYEETALEKLAREVALRPVHQTDPGKLAREVDVRPVPTTLWYLIKKNIDMTASPSERSSPSPVTETR